ncbi:hypothetical protein Tco_0683768 [Tanacetum coccineum]
MGRSDEKNSQKLTFYKAFFSPQWKFLIHTILQCLSSKTTTWNEFSSTMTSAIICLATNQKFNFSKYIFESMVKNLDNAGKFLMYPRFIKIFLDKQLEGMPTHNRIYIAPSYTKKIFRNMRRLGKGFSGRETPLFQTMVVQDQAEMGEDEADNKKMCEDMNDSLERASTTATSLDAEVGSSRMVESSENEGLGEEDASKKGRRINAIDADEDITLVNDQDDADMFDVNDLDCDEVIFDNVEVVKTVKETVNIATTTTTTTATITDVEITLAQALAELKSAKPKAVKVVIQEPKQGTTTTTPTTIISVPKPPQDKGKWIMIEEHVVEQVKPMKRLEQIRLDEELAFKLQAEEEEEERLAREKAQQTEEVNIAWDDVQAKIEADYQLAQRLQAKEQEELTDEEKARLTELVEESSKKAEAEIAQESSSKRAGDELEQENAKKQKVDEDKETTELQSLIEVIFDDEEEVAINVVPLATKPPTIVNWKIHKEGKKSYYQIIRADGKSQMYRVFSQMLKSFSREDLEDLYKLVKAKYRSTRPVEDLDLIL